MEAEVKPVVVEILGRPLTLMSGMGQERLQAVAEMVDAQLKELQVAFPASPLADLAILVALNLAVESLESKEDYHKYRTEIENRSRQLIQRLEGHSSYSPPGP